MAAYYFNVECHDYVVCCWHWSLGRIYSELAAFLSWSQSELCGLWETCLNGETAKLCSVSAPSLWLCGQLGGGLCCVASKASVCICYIPSTFRSRRAVLSPETTNHEQLQKSIRTGFSPRTFSCLWFLLGCFVVFLFPPQLQLINRLSSMAAAAKLQAEISGNSHSLCGPACQRCSAYIFKLGKDWPCRTCLCTCWDK